MYVIEGTWEEVKRHDSELIGRLVRLTVKVEKPALHMPATPARATAAPKELRGYGMFAGQFSTEEFLREKHEDILREDRVL